jgi:hypothetical protein
MPTFRIGVGCLLLAVAHSIHVAIRMIAASNHVRKVRSVGIQSPLSARSVLAELRLTAATVVKNYSLRRHGRRQLAHGVGDVAGEAVDGGIGF